MSIENTGYDEEPNIITLLDEDGTEVELEFLDLIRYEGEEYAVLLPLDEDIVVILKIETDEENETETYVGLEDEELLEKLFNIFKENNSDLYNFTD